MDREAVRAAIRKTQAHNEDAIEKMRPSHPGRTDEELAAIIWFEESMYNIEGRYVTDKHNLKQRALVDQNARNQFADLERRYVEEQYDLRRDYDNFLYGVQVEKAEAEYKRKGKSNGS